MDEEMAVCESPSSPFEHKASPEMSPEQSPPLTDKSISILHHLDDIEGVGAEGDLKQKIIKQVEYYFSDENLSSDGHMISLMKKHKEGYVPIGTIASFRKMKKLTSDVSYIASSLKESSLLVVSPDEKSVKRVLPFNDHKAVKVSTVVVENLPEDHSVENLKKIFSKVGKVKNITIGDPNEKKGKNSNMLISNKLHALVEYDSAKSALKAVATLNNEGDWRNGMQVKILKKTGKNGNKKSVKKEGTCGHLRVSDNGIEHMKPPPGPKMPDGTRGFAFGRGKPLVF